MEDQKEIPDKEVLWKESTLYYRQDHLHQLWFAFFKSFGYLSNEKGTAFAIC